MQKYHVLLATGTRLTGRGVSCQSQNLVSTRRGTIQSPQCERHSSSGSRRARKAATPGSGQRERRNSSRLSTRSVAEGIRTDGTSTIAAVIGPLDPAAVGNVGRQAVPREEALSACSSMGRIEPRGACGDKSSEGRGKQAGEAVCTPAKEDCGKGQAI